MITYFRWYLVLVAQKFLYLWSMVSPQKKWREYRDWQRAMKAGRYDFANLVERGGVEPFGGKRHMTQILLVRRVPKSPPPYTRGWAIAHLVFGTIWLVLSTFGEAWFLTDSGMDRVTVTLITTIFVVVMALFGAWIIRKNRLWESIRGR
jgi:hypothetical protein